MPLNKFILRLLNWWTFWSYHACNTICYFIQAWYKDFSSHNFCMVNNFIFSKLSGVHIIEWRYFWTVIMLGGQNFFRAVFFCWQKKIVKIFGGCTYLPYYVTYPTTYVPTYLPTLTLRVPIASLPQLFELNSLSKFIDFYIFICWIDGDKLLKCAKSNYYPLLKKLPTVLFLDSVLCLAAQKKVLKWISMSDTDIF